MDWLSQILFPPPAISDEAIAFYGPRVATMIYEIGRQQQADYSRRYWSAADLVDDVAHQAPYIMRPPSVLPLPAPPKPLP